MNEELKKEVWEEIESIARIVKEKEIFLPHGIVLQMVNKFIDHATLAERKRCAEIARNWVPEGNLDTIEKEANHE